MQDKMKVNICHKLRVAGYKISIQHYRTYIVTCAIQPFADMKKLFSLSAEYGMAGYNKYNVNFITHLPNLKRFKLLVDRLSYDTWESKDKTMKFRMLQRGGTTYVKLTDPYGNDMVGFAHCHDNDNFDNSIGTRLAIYDALEQLEENKYEF